MTREQYKRRSAALRTRLEVAKIIWQADPTETNQQRVMDMLEAYDARQAKLFERYCRESV